ncbi:MAG: trigger factor [Oxalobacteraceae bacterium]|nr:trigger factor [Oxalobacteraceae bacterium]
MATAVETLEKLERRITLNVLMSDMDTEVEKRLKVRARTAKAPGFRPGKVPMKMVSAQYGSIVQGEVLNELIDRAFRAASAEHNLRVAGYPTIEPKSDGDVEGAIVFQATFEVYPEVKIGDLASVEIERSKSEVTDAEIDKTIDILRKQRVHFHTKGVHDAHGDGGSDTSAQNGDRVTVDFVGKIDGVEFAGGKADDYAFVLGEGRMLAEFEQAALGLKAGESKTFTMKFPDDYHGKDVAGKTAEFTITVKHVEWAHLPDIDASFAESLGIADGDIQKMRDDIRGNLEREVGGRVKAKTKTNVMDALIKIAELDVPKVLLKQDAERLAEMTREDMRQRGMNVNDMPFPPELFNEQADRRVRLGLILSELVKTHELRATGDQIKSHVDDFAKAYEDPQQVVKYYFSDRQRLAEVEALVIEENVVNFVLSKAKVTDSVVPFDELMGSTQQA